MAALIKVILNNLELKRNENLKEKKEITSGRSKRKRQFFQATLNLMTQRCIAIINFCTSQVRIRGFYKKVNHI